MVESNRSRIAEAVTELSGGALDSTHHSSIDDIADPDAEIPAFAPGQRYELVKSLGEGGMGDVRLCRDRVIGREVALKAVLPAQAKRMDVRARFVREARVQGQLEHPAIVPVYDFGVDGEGHPFFTMKRVRGVTLESVLDALRAGDEKATREYTTHKLLASFVQVCLAIDFAHERGVLHRDLKPANVMLGGYGEVYVLDWGVAKVRSASRTFDSTGHEVAAPIAEDDASAPAGIVGADKSKPTAAGAVVGTPGYMAPEQLKGGDVDARTDVYALGGILFELLTHEPLHGAGSLASVMKRALAGADARASVRAPGREVAPELEAVCVKACALDPAKRHATARELADAIEAYLSGDRDLEQRRSLAKAHLERARGAADRAALPSAARSAGLPALEALSDRAEALREVGRAVALDPTNDTALELLVAMLTTPPKEPPVEVVQAVEAERQASQRRMLPRVALIYALAWVAFLPLQAYFGILDGKLIALPIAAWSVAALGVLVAHRYFAVTHTHLWVLMIFSAIAIGVSSVIFGPLLILPTLVVMSTMGTILVTRRDRRIILLVCNALALLVPTALLWAGVHPVSFVVDGDRTLRIGLAAFAVSRNGAVGVLAASHFMLFLIGARFAAVYRDALSAAETRLYLQSWQLRQLMPAEATSALGPAKSESR